MPIPVIQLSRERALRIVSDLPYLVAGSTANLLPRGAPNAKPSPRCPVIVNVAYEVWDENACYRFPEQPFQVLGRITRKEFLQCCPNGRSAPHYYRIATD
jgi:hypothetical protein